MLDQIIKNKLLEVEILKGEQEHTISDVVKMNLPKNSFVESVRDKIKNGKNAIIAELKRCSPSKGYLDKKLDIKAMASLYEKSGAACISVLTDEKFFKGTKNDLMLAKNTCSLPILRKDFIIDEYQIYESKVYQADVILLIVSILSDDELKKFLKIANELNLDCIIETHDENEIKRALKLDYPILGINNRNLKNLKTDLNNSVSLFTSISKDYTVIAESGIKTAEDINMYNDLGIFNFLIGESILRSKDYATFIKKLLNNG